MIKNILKSSAVALTMVTMIGLAKPVKVNAASAYVQATANVNVRTGTSTSYRSIGTLKKGTSVELLSTSGNWYKVQYTSNQTGWVSKSYAKNISSSSASTTTATSSNPSYVEATANVNVRTGASTSYRSLGILKKGQSVKVLSTSGSWYKIQYTNSTTGWVNKGYVKSASGASETTTSTSSSSTSSLDVKSTLTVKAYAYTGGGYTATGTKAKYGTLAVDPKVIPYGTKVYIKELDKVFTAEDCGGAIKGNTVDIYMTSESACRNWGTRTITLQILK